MLGFFSATEAVHVFDVSDLCSAPVFRSVYNLPAFVALKRPYLHVPKCSFRVLLYHL